MSGVAASICAGYPMAAIITVDVLAIEPYVVQGFISINGLFENRTWFFVPH